MTEADYFGFFSNPWTPLVPLPNTMIQLVANEPGSVMDYLLPTAKPFVSLRSRRLTQIPSCLLEEVAVDEVEGILALNAMSRHSADDRSLVINKASLILKHLAIFALGSLTSQRDVLIFFSDRASFGKFHHYLSDRIRPSTEMLEHTCDKCFTHSYDYASSFMHIVMVIDDNSQSWPMPFTKTVQPDLRQIIRRNQAPHRVLTPVLILFNTRSAIASTIYMRFALQRITKIFVTDQDGADAPFFIGVADSKACFKASNGDGFRVSVAFKNTMALDRDTTRRSIPIPVQMTHAVAIGHNASDDMNDENYPS